MAKSVRLRARGVVVIVAVSALLGLGVGGGAAALMPSVGADATPAELRAAVTYPHREPTDLRTCRIDQPGDAELQVRGMVSDAATGEVRYDHDSHTPLPTASVMKLVTAATALEVLGPDHRFTTQVLPGTDPGSVVLVGGGDVTLTAAGSGYYDLDTASLAELAAQPGLQGGQVRAVGADTSRYGGEEFAESWPAEVRGVDVGPVAPLMLDGARTNPAEKYSTRSAHPGADAAQALAAHLGAEYGSEVSAVPGAAPLAEVHSPPVRELVGLMLLESDNALAEALAREVAIELGTGNDFSAVDAAQREALARLDIDTAGFVGADGSGLSPDNRASAVTIDELLIAIEQHDDFASSILDALPRNQESGTLERRIPGVPAGGVRAKTGQIEEVFALAGWMDGEGGTRLRFVFFVTRPDLAPVQFLGDREVLDAVVTEVYACGSELGPG